MRVRPMVVWRCVCSFLLINLVATEKVVSSDSKEGGAVMVQTNAPPAPGALPTFPFVDSRKRGGHMAF